MKSKGKGAIQLRAGILRGMQASLADSACANGLAAFPESALDASRSSGPERKGHWLERDLDHALAVADRAGLEDYRVEIAPDGTIAIVVACETRGRMRKARPLSRT